MAHYVSSLKTRLEQYIHPDLDFNTVLNDVLPSLASRGIWKDLTFESHTPVDHDQSFFTLPREADSVLYAMSGNHRTEVNPLWQAYLSEGATRGKLGEWYGVEDAGFIPTKEVLDSDQTYVLFALPHFEKWGEENVTSLIASTLPTLGDGASVTISYVDYTGVEKTVTDELSNTNTPQALTPRALSRVTRISFEGLGDVPVMVVAVPCQTYGQLSSDNGLASVVPVEGLPFDTQNLDSIVDLHVEDGSDFSNFNPNTLQSTITDERIETAVPASDTISGKLVGVFNSNTIVGDVTTKTGAAEDARIIAVADDNDNHEILRYRAFRIHTTGKRIAALYRRKITTVVSDNDVVPISNLTALRYAILANTAEHNNDFETSRKWWAAATKELDRELDSSLGAALPNLSFDPTGGLGGVFNAV